jgi:hypothetical protein
MNMRCSTDVHTQIKLILKSQKLIDKDKIMHSIMAKILWSYGQYFQNKFLKCLKHHINNVREEQTEITACGGRRNFKLTMR